MKKLNKIEADDIIALLDKKYTLVYCNYQDNLDNSLENVEKSIKSQDLEFLYGNMDEWIWDSQWESIKYIKEHDLLDSVMAEFELEKEDAKELIEKFEEEIRYAIEERDDSDVISDLIRNTSDPVIFYDTGEEIYFDVPFGSDKEMKECLKQIKKTLKIKLSETKWDDKLEIMIQQGYSGRLVIYFTGDINEMMNLSDKNTITFSDPNIAIINTSEGSGDNCQLSGHKFSLPLDTESIFLDRLVKYSYTYEVCGMSSNWCNGTSVKFEKKREYKNKLNPSSLNDEKNHEEHLNAHFKAGNCTRGDMDMRRHRNTFYINDFPCGTHCPTCKTFWID